MNRLRKRAARLAVFLESAGVVPLIPDARDGRDHCGPAERSSPPRLPWSRSTPLLAPVPQTEVNGLLSSTAARTPEQPWASIISSQQEH